MSIGDVMDLLEQNDRDKLMLHFEAGKPCHIVYEDNKVVGVNMPPDNVTVTLQGGAWYLGEIK